MRVLFLSAVTFICLCVLDLVSNGSVRHALMHIPESRLVRTLERSYFDKQVKISGLSILAPERIQKLLPLEHSIVWWHMNREAIAQSLREQPFIEQVKVERCGALIGGGLRCFEVRISERSPSLIAELKGENWLVARGGALLMPVNLSKDNLELLRDQFGAIALLAGLEEAQYSPDLLQRRLKYAEEALRIIRIESAQPIELARIAENGELEVSLRGLALKARFEYSPDSPERLKDEARRLKALLEHYKGREESLKEIDLAFNNLAVVRTF